LTKVVVYSKEGCHLCETVISTLQRLSLESPIDLSSRDITEDAGLFERYKNIIPVVEVDGKVRLGGAALSNKATVESILRKVLLASRRE
jgi:glutaredoxin